MINFFLFYLQLIVVSADYNQNVMEDEVAVELSSNILKIILLQYFT